jgi:glycosyltransferase involved in cell wall biosynthesis
MTVVPTTSFVVTTFRKAAYVDDLVASLADQEIRGGAELVLVDDASPDDTLARVEAALARHRDRFHGVEILVADRNAGPAHAVNAGIAAARGRYVHFVDGDDRLPRGAAAAMVAEADRGADIVYGGKHHFSGDEPRRDFRPSTAIVGEPALLALVRQRLVGIRFLAERETALAAAGADTGVLIQDVSLPLRIAARAKRLAFIPSAVIEVRGVSGSLSSNPLQELHDFVLAVARFIETDPVPPDVVRILVGRSWRRLLRTPGFTMRHADFVLRFLGAATGHVPPSTALALMETCNALAAENRIRQAMPAPSYRRVGRSEGVKKASGDEERE